MRPRMSATQRMRPATVSSTFVWVLTEVVVGRGKGVVPGREIGLDIVRILKSRSYKECGRSLLTASKADSDFEYFHT